MPIADLSVLDLVYHLNATHTHSCAAFVSLSSISNIMVYPNRLSEFCDFDLLANYERLAEAASTASCLNFAIEFNSDNASAAVDLQVEAIASFLNKKREKGRNTQWINIFAPDQQVECVKVNRYISLARLD